jgi:hypothetical protein
LTTAFPTSLDVLTNPSSSDTLGTVAVLHSTQHANLNDAVEALQAKVGADSSAVTTSLDYLLRHIDTSWLPTTITLNNNATATASLPTIITNAWLRIVGTDAAANNGIQLESFAGQSDIWARRANGTGASQSALALDDVILSINSRGFGLNAYSSGSRAVIRSRAAEAWSNSAQGTYWEFLTSAIGAANATVRLTIASAGITVASGTPLTIATTTDATSKTTGACIVSGGIGAAKNIIAGEGMAVGVASVVTAAGTTTLTSASAGVQIFTGSTTQTVQLPAANLFGAGIAVQYALINRSSGSVSWQRAGSDTINGATSTVAVSSNTVSIIYSDGVSAWYTK